METFISLNKIHIFPYQNNCYQFHFVIFFMGQKQLRQILVMFASMVFKVHSYTFLHNSHNSRRFSLPAMCEETETGVNKLILLSVDPET